MFLHFTHKHFMIFKQTNMVIIYIILTLVIFCCLYFLVIILHGKTTRKIYKYSKIPLLLVLNNDKH